MKKFRVIITVEDEEPITQLINAKTWKSALVKHSVLQKTAILELAELWLMSYQETLQHYSQFDIKVQIYEI